ncbi:DUF4189 domain-containing protein [Mycobacterium sp. NBC_00419]|uniref:DUF4189 domain-containing protein n=1 Tax=Mycobacterium sp. NBC_00419 TaxID=2975989 RepID=UPI003FA536AF
MICRSAITTAVVASSFLVAPTAQSSPLVAAPECPPGTHVNPDDLSSCLPNTPGNDYVAFAVANNGYAYAGKGISERESTRIAMAGCVATTNSACEIVASTHNNCVAIATDMTTGAVQAGVGTTPDAASANALATLSNGQVYATECPEP